MTKKKRKIAFFDFDGTLTSKDSLTEFYKYMYKDSYVYNYYLRFIVLLILVMLNVKSYTSLKISRLRFLTKKFSIDELREESRVFFEKFISDQLKKEGEIEIDNLKKRNVEIVVVSASIDLLLSNFKAKMNVELITNELEITNGLFTGKFLHQKDCNFDEKVRRIKEIYNLNDYNEILAYGDSAGDYAMFEIADKAFLNHFKE